MITLVFGAWLLWSAVAAIFMFVRDFREVGVSMALTSVLVFITFLCFTFMVI